jgi:uncharacterized membrane protein required for colicin V production
LDCGVQTSGVSSFLSLFFQDRNFDTLCGMSGVFLFLLQLHTFFCKLASYIHNSQNIIITLLWHASSGLTMLRVVWMSMHDA